MARILVVDDQAVYRTGLRSLISTQILGAEVLEAHSLPQALPQIQHGAFDLVLLGLDLSDSEAVDALTSAREASPATRFAILSASDARADILASLGRRIARLHFKAPIRRRYSGRHHPSFVRADLCASLARRSR